MGVRPQDAAIDGVAVSEVVGVNDDPAELGMRGIQAMTLRGSTQKCIGLGSRPGGPLRDSPNVPTAGSSPKSLWQCAWKNQGLPTRELLPKPELLAPGRQANARRWQVDH